MDSHTDMDTMASVLLMLSPRLMLSHTIMADMDMDTLDIVDTMDTHIDTDTTASVLLMLTHTFSMEDMDMDILDTLDTMDTLMVDMPTGDKLYSVTDKGQKNHQCLHLQ